MIIISWLQLSTSSYPCNSMQHLTIIFSICHCSATHTLIELFAVSFYHAHLVRPVSIKFPEFSFFRMCPININCLFLILRKRVLLVSVVLELPLCSYVLRTAYLPLLKNHISGRKSSSSHCRTGREMWHSNLIRFSLF